MTDWSSIKATLQAWELQTAGIGKAEVEALLLECEYVVQAAADYPGVTLYYRKDWPRFMSMAAANTFPAESLRRIAERLLNEISRRQLA